MCFFLQTGSPLFLCLHFRLRLQQASGWPLRPGQNFGKLAGQVSSPLQMMLPGGVALFAQAGQVVLPLFGCAVPAGQAVQMSPPAFAENEPGWHGVQVALPMFAAI